MFVGKRMKTIFDTAEEVGNLKTLTKILEETKLDGLFKSGGPYTLFAPSDEAFHKLPQETLDRFMSDKDILAQLVKFHVVEDRVLTKDIRKMKSAQTMEGERVTFDTTNFIEVNRAKVTEPDIKCTNGVIQVIDQVLIPGAPLIKT